MGNDWDGEYELVDTGTMFATVRRERPAKSKPRRDRSRCGITKDDGKRCRRVVPCPDHSPTERSQSDT